MYSNFAEFQQIYQKWRNNPKKRALDILMKHAKGVQCIGSCCFGFTCLCCCCNGSSTYCNMSEVGSNWANAMKTYQNINPVKVDMMFEKGILTLQQIAQRYNAALETMEKEVKHQHESGSMENYQQMKFQYTMMRVSVGGTAWFTTLMDHVYNNMLGRQTPLKYITLNSEEVDTLEKCLPFFYPATQKEDLRYVHKIDSKVLKMLQNRMSLC